MARMMEKEMGIDIEMTKQKTTPPRTARKNTRAPPGLFQSDMAERLLKIRDNREAALKIRARTTHTTAIQDKERNKWS